MCAINPKHHFKITINVYTSLDMSQETFKDITMAKILKTEHVLNEDMRFRWHVVDFEEVTK